MNKILVLLLIIFPIKLLAIKVEIIADVNGEPISTLDIEKRIKQINLLFHTKDEKNIKCLILNKLINEIIIINEAKALNIKLSDEELNDAIISFLTQNFKIKSDKINQYIREHDINIEILKKEIKYQLLWKKIIEVKIAPFIVISNQEINNTKLQMEKPECLITFQEFLVPATNQETNNTNYSIAENLIKKIRNNNGFIPESQTKMRQTTVNLNQCEEGNLKSALKRLERGETAGPFNLIEGHYSIIKIIDKVQLDHMLLESTLKLKQATIKNSEGILDELKERNINCINFDKLIDDFKLSDIKEFEIKMRDLNYSLQALLSKAEINKIVEFKENSATKLVMLCDIKSSALDIEDIKQKLYQQKLIIQSNLLLDNMRKNTAIIYR